MTPTLTADVALHPITGTAVVDVDEAETAADAGEHLASDDVIADAARRLAEYGFDIEEAGPVRIRISGPPELFREVFGVDGSGGDGELDVPDGLSDVVAGVSFTE